MGQMQRRKRLNYEVTGRAKLRVIFRGMARVTLTQLEAAAQSGPQPMSVKAFAESLAANGVTIWYDAVNDEIRASAYT